MGSFMLLLILVTQVSPPCEIRFVMYICANMVLLGLSTLFSCSVVNLSLRTTPMPSATRTVRLETHGETERERERERERARERQRQRERERERASERETETERERERKIQRENVIERYDNLGVWSFSG